MKKTDTINKGDKVYFFVEDNHSQVYLREDVVANIHYDDNTFYIITSRYGVSLDLEDLGEVWDTNKHNLLIGVDENED